MTQSSLPPAKISITDSWLWRMAWRDSRAHRSRLLLFMASIILGIAALVAITSFGESLERAVDDQARTLLGADLELRSAEPFSTLAESVIDSLGGAQSREIAFASMAYFPKSGGTRLAQVRALSGEFPYYGELETVPPGQGARYQAAGGALVDQGLMRQFGVAVGDSVKLGTYMFPVVGELTKVPDQAGAGMTIAPRIYIPLNLLEQTGLVRFGSRVSYRVFFKFEPGREVANLAEQLENRLRGQRIRIETVESRKETFGAVMKNLYRFLNLVAFIALLLGSIGVASSIHVYIKQKLASIAVLRCVGAQIRQTFYIYLIQAGVLGLIGSLAGAALGTLIQTFLPQVLDDFLLVEVDFILSGTALLKGLSTGLVMTLLFALLPLIAIRKVSPLLAIRASYESDAATRRDPLRWVIYGIIAVVVVVFAVSQTREWLYGIAFAAGLAIAFGLLAGMAKLLIWLVQRFFPRSWSYPWRQSLANLYRPNNQTLVLMLALGLGTFLITNLFLIQDILLRQVAASDSGNQPNLIFFDIQVDQNEALGQLVHSKGLPVYQNVPIVTLRLKSIQGREVEAIRDDSTSSIPSWALMREYRVTYRDTLINTEAITAGTWVSEMPPPADTVLISLESGIAEELQLGVGDDLVVDVQGVPLNARVGSIRRVNWQRVQPNFFIVFPKGVLEEAPQIRVLVTRTASAESSAALQQAVVEAFPNVSAIDLTLVLRTVESILNKIAFVIRFMALFSILTGLIVLVAAVVTTRFQRIQESVLLRTLGAWRELIRRILAQEYLYLGLLASLTGVLLAVASAWALARFAFQASFQIAWLPLLSIVLLVVGLTVLLGMLNSRGIATRPPLEILRAEG